MLNTVEKPEQAMCAARLRRTLKRLRLLILDVDGVMTDGRLFYADEGGVYRGFHVHDGMGIVRAHQAGIKVAMLSGKTSEAMAKRAEDLGIEDCLQGISDKRAAYESLLAKYGIRDDEVAYIGDDVNDLPAMGRAGFKVAVRNARGKVKEIADYVTEAEGGRGAVREVVDLILDAQQQGGKG